MNSYNDILIALERGDVDQFDALVLMTNLVEARLAEDSLLTTRERESIEAAVAKADDALLTVAANVWADQEFAGLPTTTEGD